MYSYESLQLSQPLDMTMNHALDRSNVTYTQCDKKERNDETAIKPTTDDSYTQNGFSLVVNTTQYQLNTICFTQ